MARKRFVTVTLVNGRLVDDRLGQVSVFDNALLYAEGLFETFLGVDDKVVYLKEHLDRLYRGAKVTGFRVPVGRETLLRWLNRAAKLHPDQVTKVRLTITSGVAARWTGIPGKPQVLISSSPHTIQMEPYSLHLSELRVDQDSIFRRVKTISYAIHAAALKKAKSIGCDDAIMLNENDEIAEVTSANMYWVKNGIVYTPSLADGCLDGITRRKILTMLNRMRIPVEMATDRIENVVKADELFISSSLKLAAAVDKIVDGQRKYRLPVGNITRRLREQFVSSLGLPSEIASI